MISIDNQICNPSYTSSHDPPSEVLSLSLSVTACPLALGISHVAMLFSYGTPNRPKAPIALVNWEACKNPEECMAWNKQKWLASVAPQQPTWLCV